MIGDLPGSVQALHVSDILEDLTVLLLETLPGLRFECEIM